MRYISVCSGIEAASVAWEPLGWEAVAFAEIDPFASAVLAQRFPHVPNWGDMTKFKEWPDVADVDVLVGGTPCQSFSIAGLRKGLDDPRGNLLLTYLAIAARYRPRFLVWENVPGVLSSNGGRDFGTLLGGMGELGYGVAYKVLDAEYVRVESHPRAVPQRRRRVFVVGHLGDWRRAAAVLFERESLRGHPPPRRVAGKAASTLPSRSTAGGGLGTDFDCDGGLIVGRGDPERSGSGGRGGLVAQPTKEVVSSIDASFGRLQGASHQDANHGHSHLIPFVPAKPVIAVATGQAAAEICVDFSPTLNCAHEQPYVAHALAFKASHFTRDKDGAPSEVTPPLSADADKGDQDTLVMAPVTVFTGDGEVADPVSANEGRTYTHEGENNFRMHNCVGMPFTFDQVQITSKLNRSTVGPELPASTLAANSNMHVALPAAMAVRRLTPLETERLQGFPDGWTDIVYKGKRSADGPRYKAIGNSMATNCMSWIGQRIAMVDALVVDSPPP